MILQVFVLVLSACMINYVCLCLLGLEEEKQIDDSLDLNEEEMKTLDKAIIKNIRRRTADCSSSDSDVPVDAAGVRRKSASFHLKQSIKSRKPKGLCFHFVQMLMLMYMFTHPSYSTIFLYMFCVCRG